MSHHSRWTSDTNLVLSYCLHSSLELDAYLILLACFLMYRKRIWRDEVEVVKSIFTIRGNTQYHKKWKILLLPRCELLRLLTSIIRAILWETTANFHGKLQKLSHGANIQGIIVKVLRVFRISGVGQVGLSQQLTVQKPLYGEGDWLCSFLVNYSAFSSNYGGECRLLDTPHSCTSPRAARPDSMVRLLQELTSHCTLLSILCNIVAISE